MRASVGDSWSCGACWSDRILRREQRQGERHLGERARFDHYERSVAFQAFAMNPSAIRDLMVEAFDCYNRTDVVPAADEFDRSFDERLTVLAQGGEDAIKVAKPHLDAENPRERAAVAEIIGRVGEMSGEPLRSETYDLLFARLLVEGHPGVSATVAAMVGLIWSSGDSEAPLSLVDHPNPTVRRAVAEHIALITTDRPEHRAVLERFRGDTDEDVRRWAEFGLDTLAE